MSARSYQSYWPRAVATLITLASGLERFREKALEYKDRYGVKLHKQSLGGKKQEGEK